MGTFQVELKISIGKKDFEKELQENFPKESRTHLLTSSLLSSSLTLFTMEAKNIVLVFPVLWYYDESENHMRWMKKDET